MRYLFYSALMLTSAGFLFLGATVDSRLVWIVLWVYAAIGTLMTMDHLKRLMLSMRMAWHIWREIVTSEYWKVFADAVLRKATKNVIEGLEEANAKFTTYGPSGNSMDKAVMEFIKRMVDEGLPEDRIVRKTMKDKAGNRVGEVYSVPIPVDDDEADEPQTGMYL